MIAFDITRLFLGPLSRSPRGIDRVDFALGRYLFDDECSPHVGVLPTPWGVRLYDAAQVRRGIGYIGQLWAEGSEDRHDPRWPGLVDWLRTSSGYSDNSPEQRWNLAIKVGRILGELRATGLTPGRSARRRLPHSAIYLNVGQIGLAVPAFHRWQKRRRDVTVITMLHDTIPIEHPEHVERSSVRDHQRMVATAARYSHALIVTTEHARRTVTAELGLCGVAALPTLVRSLPLPRSLAEPRRSEPMLAQTRYFVCCGTIEPRKNHAFLLTIWRSLVERLGDAAPRLVLVGSKGYRADALLRPLIADDLLRRHVAHVAGLSSAALARLMLGASAILCPSLAEGFGLPLYEANALGLPTIASDIPSHREIADRATMLLDPTDIEAWVAAITAAPDAPPRQTPTLDQAVDEIVYCRDVVDFCEVSARRRGLIPSVPDHEGTVYASG